MNSLQNYTETVCNRVEMDYNGLQNTTKHNGKTVYQHLHFTKVAVFQGVAVKECVFGGGVVLRNAERTGTIFQGVTTEKGVFRSPKKGGVAVSCIPKRGSHSK